MKNFPPDCASHRRLALLEYASDEETQGGVRRGDLPLTKGRFEAAPFALYSDSFQLSFILPTCLIANGDDCCIRIERRRLPYSYCSRFVPRTTIAVHGALENVSLFTSILVPNAYRNQLSLAYPARNPPALYKGTQRQRTVQVYVDGDMVTTWTSSGTTDDFESIGVTGAAGKAIDIVGVLGESEWLSIIEVNPLFQQCSRNETSVHKEISVARTSISRLCRGFSGFAFRMSSVL